MTEIIESIATMLWGYVLIYLLVGAGVYFTICSRFVQVRYFMHAWKIALKSRKTDRQKISSFQALCTSMAAHVGTGNLAGVAIAIYIGGPGAVFWMWVVAMLGMASSFVENTLAQLYKTNNNDGTFRGGPAYYIEKAFGLRWLGLLFSALLLITFGFVFNAVHSNSVSLAVSAHTLMTPELIGFAMALITAAIVFRGIRSIVRFAEKVVPFMAMAYLLIAAVVIIMNVKQLPDVFWLIINSAFGLESAAGGAFGYATAQAIMQGIKRGLFSNEAGMGSGPNAAATATPDPHHPAAQGIISMISVFIDTIVICTATAAIVLLSGQLDSASTLNGIQLTQTALATTFGSAGEWFISLAVIFFGFTSVIANYYYGESNLLFMKDNRKLLFLYRFTVIVLVYIGAVSPLESVWLVADLSMGLMALINLLVIVMLSGPVMQVLRDYDRQVKEGESPVFSRHNFPFLNKTMDEDVWNDVQPDDKLNTDNQSSESSDNLPEAEGL